jgi:ATP-dependent Clp protease protease subunit
MKNVLRIIFGMCLATTIYCSKILEFTSRNLITIRGPIQGTSVTNWINQINDRDPDADTMYIYLTSPGGSVLEGNKIIDQIKTMELAGVNVVCVADFAASMAFVILQACQKRTALPSSVLMQHQMSLGLEGPIENINNYLDFIQQIRVNLEVMQSERLNMTVDDFKNKIVNDWWVPGYNAKNASVIDELVMVKCSREIITKREKISINTMFGTIEISYSKCPIARQPLDIKMVDFNNKLSLQEVEHIIKDYVPSIWLKNYHSKNHESNFFQ